MLALGLIAGCAVDRLHREGLAAIDAGNYEEGIAKLEQAVKEDPDNLAFRLDLKAQRDWVVQQLIFAADSARHAGNLDEAERLYRRVLALQSGNDRAQRGIAGIAADRGHAVLIDKAQKDLEAGNLEQADAIVRAVLAEDPTFAPAALLSAKIEELRPPVTVVPRLHTRDSHPVTLQFRDANTKMVFEVLSRQSGINFIFDKDVRSDSKTTIFVQQVPVEQAIELVLGQNQLARQILSENMVLIYPNNAQKQKEYQDQIVKTIYLTNADTKQAQNLLKTVLNAKTLFIDERANQIVIRDTPETIRMAEKLLASLDLPEPEVMMEVEILEINRSLLEELGIKYPTAVTLSATPVDGGDTLHLSDLSEQNKSTITVTPLSITIDLLKQVGGTNVLASPRIRARNREKARIHIGSRVPVITNSVTPTAGGTAVVTGSVQYVDIGLALEVEPTIYLDSDVAIKVNLEVSNIIKTVNDVSSGTLAYEIGTRSANTLLQLKDGETQILAGLIDDRDTRNSSHIPGLGDIPVVGRLFGSQRTARDKTEIVMSLTPRIIRSQPRPASDETEFWYGTENSIRGAPLGASSAASGTGGGASAGGPNGDAVELSVANAAPDVAAAPPESPPATQSAAPEPMPKPAPSVPGAPTTSWDAPGQTSAGQSFEVAVRFAGGSAMKNVRAQIHYDPAVLQLVTADAGDVIPSEIKTVAVPRINQMAGVLQFVANASAEAPVQGDGSLLVLHFKALAPNPATKITLQLATVGADGATLRPTVQQPLTIVVTP